MEINENGDQNRHAKMQAWLASSPQGDDSLVKRPSFLPWCYQPGKQGTASLQYQQPHVLVTDGQN